MTLSATTFRIHRWLGWLIGLQVLVWVAGGVVFSLVPFNALVKGGETVKAPKVVLPAGWAQRVGPGLQAAASLGDVVAVTAVATPQGPGLRVNYRGDHQSVIVLADGTAWTPPDEAALRRSVAASLRRCHGHPHLSERQHRRSTKRSRSVACRRFRGSLMSIAMGAPIRVAARLDHLRCRMAAQTTTPTTTAAESAPTPSAGQVRGQRSEALLDPGF